jgi:hypothetical protein
MSFTQDELQAFNTILEQRLSAQRRDLERTFEQRLNAFKVTFEQRLDALQQTALRMLTLRFSEQQLRMRETLDQRLQTQQARIAQTIEQQHEQLLQKQQAQVEDVVERALAAQLLGIEQLLSRHRAGMLSGYADGNISLDQELTAGMIEAIEVQTEIPWDDIADMFNRTLDDRLARLGASLQASLQHMEQRMLAQAPRASQNQETFSSASQSGDASTDIQQILSGIEQLERIVESMQVAMTANHAFLSNRLFHHQQLPLERAHPHAAQANSASEPVSLVDLQEAHFSLSGDSENLQ